MIKIIEKKDLKKFSVKKVFESILDNIFDAFDYLEFSEGDTFYLAVKNKKNKEVICLSEESKGNFLRSVRDNHKDILSHAKKKNILKKVYDNTSEPLDPVSTILVDLKIKTKIQLDNFCKRVQQLNKRLQNVFVVNDNFRKVARVFDHENNLIVLPAISESFEEVLKEIKYSKIVLFVRDEKVPYKKLKMLGLTNLSYKKDSTKHVWIKNININEFASTQT